jgi:hypothetical protein
MQLRGLADDAKIFFMRYLHDQCTLDVDRYDVVLSMEHDRLLDGRRPSTGSTWYIAFAVMQHAQQFQASYARAPEPYSLIGCHQAPTCLGCFDDVCPKPARVVQLFPCPRYAGRSSVRTLPASHGDLHTTCRSTPSRARPHLS